MTAKRLMYLLKSWLYNHEDIDTVDAKHYAGGAAIHVVSNTGKKFRILIEEED